MKISLLCPDLGINCLGRTFVLAQILARRYQVDLIGPVKNGSENIWEPLRDTTYPNVRWVPIPFHGNLRPILQARAVVDACDGDLIYAHKPLWTSFGQGKRAAHCRDVPLILDIDDWDLGFLLDMMNAMPAYKQVAYLGYSVVFYWKMASYWNTLFGEGSTGEADAITVSNHYLQEKFGGSIVPHVRDTDTVFNPAKYDRDRLRKEAGFAPDDEVVLFSGTPRLHKGVNVLVDAVKACNRPNLKLCVVGISNHPYARQVSDYARQHLGDQFVPVGMVPFGVNPRFLAMADLVVIPQNDMNGTVGQMPAKLFDAMAMAKPIVSTAVSDIPAVLDGGGWIVPPGDQQALTTAITTALENPDLGEQKGDTARARCIERYSLHAAEPVLCGIVETLT